MIHIVLLAVAINFSDSACSRDLTATATTLRDDYPGYRSLTPEQHSALAALFDSLGSAASRSTSPYDCTDLIRRYVGAFHDGHLSVSGPRRPEHGSQPTTPDAEPRTALNFLDDSTAFLTLPDFSSARPIDSVLTANGARLATTPRLIIDVRGNGGGSDYTFAGVMRLLYTDSIARPGVQALASPGNIAALRARSAAMRDSARRRAADSVLALMERHQGEFVLMSNATRYGFASILAMPRRAIIISGRFCASSCEQFLLDAKQSGKVTVVGAQNTYGMLDYSSVRSIPLPSGQRTLGVPMMRVMRDRPLNNVGVAPDVLIPPSDTSDALMFARRYLRDHPTASRRE